jgi:endoglucanase
VPEDAARILHDLLAAMRIENCEWRSEVVAAITGVRPRVIPAWGFGFRGASASYSVAGGTPLAGIRADDAAGIRFAAEGGNPANPFEQSDGRTYLPEERLVVDLAAGDWLEFEVEDGDPAVVRAFGPDGELGGVRIEPSPRGLRVVADRPVTLAHLDLGTPGG